MKNKMEQVCASVMERVTPHGKERTKIESLAKKLVTRVFEATKTVKVAATVRLEGSVAKDTWLSGEPDLDIFVRVPATLPRKSLGDVGLQIARIAMEGYPQIERFAEHPYLEAIVDGVTVNVVPCYDVIPREWHSATDRTPYHTDYVNRKLDPTLRREVRLLKRFMKGVGVYGAEIKIGGFSGYLCELLIISCEGFLKTLEMFAGYTDRIILDLEHAYAEKRELEKLFNEKLVIVDPVDKGRNVAAAVNPQQFSTVVAAARFFREHPTDTFFYPAKTKNFTADELSQEFRKRGTTFIFILVGAINVVPDVLWGQLYKSHRALRNLLQQHDFKIVKDRAWSDEKTLNTFVFELEHSVLPFTKKQLGPPLEKELDCRKFLEKHRGNLRTVAGPYIEEGRWMVELSRKYSDPTVLLHERLMDGGRRVGIASQIAKKLHLNAQIYRNDEIIGTYQQNQEFATFLTDFLTAKPKWLETEA